MRGLAAGILLLLSAEAAGQCIADAPVDITIRLQKQRGTEIFQRHEERITSAVRAYFQPSINIRFTDDPGADAQYDLTIRRKIDWCGTPGISPLCRLFKRSSLYGWAYLNGPEGEIYIFKGHRVQERKNPDMYVDLTTLVMRHEIGHLLGLDHNEAAGNIMNATIKTISDQPLNCEQREQAYSGALAAKNNL